MTTTEGLRARMDTTAERREAEKASLYRLDGSQIFGPEEHGERMREIADEIARVAEEVRAGADKIAEERQRDLDAIRYADPTEGLSAGELERANARAAFVREDCETMAPDELARRIRGVLAGGDRETAWLYHRYAKARHERKLALSSRADRPRSSRKPPRSGSCATPCPRSRSVSATRRRRGGAKAPRRSSPPPRPSSATPGGAPPRRTGQTSGRVPISGRGFSPSSRRPAREAQVRSDGVARPVPFVGRSGRSEVPAEAGARAWLSVGAR